MNVRSIVGSLICFAFLVTSSVALAEPGKIVLVGGQVIAGDIQEVVKGDYIVIEVADGDVRAIPWSNIDSFMVGEPTSPTPPPPAPTVVYVAAPSARWSPPPPPPRFEPTWTLGARVGTMVVGGNVYGDYDHYHEHDHAEPRLAMRDIAGFGWMFEGDLGYHFSPSWTVYGLWEHGELDHGDLNANGRGHTNAIGAGISANTSPRDTMGFYFDAGAAYRWMEFTDISLDPAARTVTRTSVEGFDFFRGSVGVVLQPIPKLWIIPHIYTSYGYFTRFKGTACPSGCSFDSQGIDPGYHSFSGLAVNGRFDL